MRDHQKSDALSQLMDQMLENDRLRPAIDSVWKTLSKCITRVNTYMQNKVICYNLKMPSANQHATDVDCTNTMGATVWKFGRMIGGLGYYIAHLTRTSLSASGISRSSSKLIVKALPEKKAAIHNEMNECGLPMCHCRALNLDL